MSRTETVRAPRGAQLSCKGGHQGAARGGRMNNRDPEVSARPADHGGGNAARGHP